MQLVAIQLFSEIGRITVKNKEGLKIMRWIAGVYLLTLKNVWSVGGC